MTLTFRIIASIFGLIATILFTFGFKAWGVISISLALLFLVAALLANKQSSTISSNQTTAQSILDDTYFLYNETGLLVKHCFNAAQEVSWRKLAPLNVKFDDYLKNIKGRLLAYPQELELKIFRLFDILFDYKRRSEIIVSSAKIHSRYKDQQDLEQKFTEEVPLLYSEIEVELRKILNKKSHNQ